MEFCERRLCATIVEPANAWTNIAYLVVGVIVLVLAMREKQQHLAPIGVIGIVLSAGSFFFHGTATFAGEVCDLGAMFLFSSFWLTREVHRLYAPSPKVLWSLYVALVAIAIGAHLVAREAGIAIFTLQIVATFSVSIAWRYRGRMRGDPRPDNRALVALIVMFGIAYAVWRLDFHRILCNPDNHVLQGHAAWHVLNSTCFYFLYRYLAQFGQTPLGRRSSTPSTASPSSS